jgi:hypothetical protein
LGGIKLVEKKDFPFELQFVKNGMKNLVKRKPIHGMAHWVPSLDKVIMFFENLSKKQQVGLVCLMNKLDGTFAPTNINKGFKH